MRSKAEGGCGGPKSSEGDYVEAEAGLVAIGFDGGSGSPNESARR